MRRTAIPDTYVRKSILNPIKVEINKVVAKEFKKAMKKDTFVVVLDSAERLTLKTLKKYGVNRVDIPNPTEAYNTIKRYHRNTYKMYFNDYLDTISPICAHQVSGAWLDYCCGTKGNDKVNPKKDIEKLFKNGLLCDKSVLAFTFCFRNSKGVDFKYQDMYEIESFIQETGMKNNYVLIRIPYARLYDGMFFEIFQVRIV